jgi:hypothetical protein
MKLKYRDKVKTFYKDIEANRFLGTHIHGMIYRPITSTLYYEFDRHEFWDDGEEMTGEEWAAIAKALINSSN